MKLLLLLWVLFSPSEAFGVSSYSSTTFFRALHPPLHHRNNPFATYIPHLWCLCCSAKNSAHNQVDDRENISLMNHHQDEERRFSDLISRFGQALYNAGELTADMASKLPNWYSSKEGLTTESPAVFGGGGLALMQAGQACLEASTICAMQKREQQEEQKTASDCQNIQDKFLQSALGAASCDLALAACHMEAIGLGDELDLACTALDSLLQAHGVKESGSPDDSDKKMNSQSSSTTAAASTMNTLDPLLHDAATSLQEAALQFQDYGALLGHEEKNKSNEGQSAGNILARAGDELHRSGEILLQIIAHRSGAAENNEN